jgi:GT2 family glycosyltransferase/tetratricopeptide (TPR) repeat protein
MRPTASIVIPAWNEWELTRACLESLRPTLGLRDQVIVVDNGSVDATGRGLARYSWVEVVSHPQNLGFAAGCNSGAAVARNEVVVFLNNDTLVPSRWLDGMLAPFTDATVGATGPRSNQAAGSQLVPEVTYDCERMSSLQRYVRDWRAEHRGQTRDTARLDGFCLAVRHDLFVQLGGLKIHDQHGGSEIDDLCVQLGEKGYRLLVAEDSFVHRVSPALPRQSQEVHDEHLLTTVHSRQQRTFGDGRLLLSACMIVKNEEVNLPSCLAAVRELVDEIVVYDTGSNDRTRELARAAGATVVDGRWDDDFARARNSALAHCQGEWILHVDADELAIADAGRLRSELAQTTADALEVEIDNLGDGGEVAVEHVGVRLFRRRRAHWQGRLHERVVTRDRPLAFARCAALRLRHSGYTAAAQAAGDKLARNLRIALAAVEADGGDDLHARIGLARALSSVGRHEEAVFHLNYVRTTTSDSELLRHALRSGAEALVALERPQQALSWLQSLRTHTDSSAMADHLEGLAHAQAGDVQAALEALARVDRASDEEMRLGRHTVRVQRAQVLTDAGRWREAAHELWTLASAGLLPLHSWPSMVEAHWRGGLELERVADVVPDDAVPVLGRVLKAPAEAVDLLLEALVQRWGPDPRLLATAAQLGSQLSLQRALDWSLRLRAEGLVQECTLAALAGSATAPPLDRLRACAVLHEAVGDPRGSASLAAAAAAVPTGDLGSALLALDELCPRLLGEFVALAACDSQRTSALAEILRSLGAVEQAELLLAEGAV